MPDLIEMRTRAFRCVIGNNAEHGEHRAGYNGAWSLVPEGSEHSLFVPGVAGLNLEHYFDGWQNSRREVLFEPRVAAMSLERMGERSVKLTQAPTPFWGVESVTTFSVAEPNVIDLEFRCTPRKAVFHNGVMGVFWASYIHTPAESAIHFRGREPGGVEKWIAYSSPRHGEASSILSEKDDLALEISEEQRNKLFATVAPARYSQPFFYGHWERYYYLLAFRSEAILRFAMSPSGGGQGNPAWDFQILVPEVKVGQEYRLRARAIVDRWDGEESVERRARDWLGQ
jgi:hypothetical protein